MAKRRNGLKNVSHLGPSSWNMCIRQILIKYSTSIWCQNIMFRFYMQVIYCILDIHIERAPTMDLNVKYSLLYIILLLLKLSSMKIFSLSSFGTFTLLSSNKFLTSARQFPGVSGVINFVCWHETQLFRCM